MKTTQKHQTQVELTAENIGGINQTKVEISPGITILTGRNATNRTSLLKAIMTALGSDQGTLKGDAEKGSVALSLGSQTFTRTLIKQNGFVKTSGDPYLDDSKLADLFAFLLESNAARRAVERGDDLRDLILRPVDTEAIKAEIEQLTIEKDRLDDDLDRLESLRTQLPTLEEEHDQLECQINKKQAALETKERDLKNADEDFSETNKEKNKLEKKLEELHETRSRLENIQFKIGTEEDSLEALNDEFSELQSKQVASSNLERIDIEETKRNLETLRERRHQLDNTISELQMVIQFNKEMLEEKSPEIRRALRLSPDNDISITDQLNTDEASIGCWTCSTIVKKSKIESTLDRLQALRETKLTERNDVKKEISVLKHDISEYQVKEKEQEQINSRLQQLQAEVTNRESKLDNLRDERDSLTEQMKRLEGDVEKLEQEDYNGILELHREANQVEFELERLESNLEEVANEITDINNTLSNKEEIEQQQDEIRGELVDLRTRIDQIEVSAIDEFNDHMATMLDLLDYANLERIWIERTEKRVQDGRRKSTKHVFDLHVVRCTESGSSYEDTVDHLSESEREVTGLVFALAGYLVHDVHNKVPFILLDSLEAIDSDRIATLVDYFSEYASYLVTALLPEDAAALDNQYERITSI